MSSAFAFLKTLFGGAARRLQSLRASGRTVDVNALTESDQVVEVGLGFGPEFWRVRPGYALDPGAALVDGGELVLEGERPLARRERLAFLRRDIEKVSYKM